MAFQLTEEQQSVIAFRNGSLLVSAAAGSGKTAVLIERILKLISDPAAPVDVDRLLVVTFTRAAAAEVKERLYKAIRGRLDLEPGNRQLRRQLKLLDKAEVSTIDSFCSNFLKSHFHEIGLDPAFRVAETNEAELLKSDVFAAMIEEEYQKGEEAFIDFTEDFSTGRSDEQIEKTILRLHAFSESAPWPEEWLKNCVRVYETPEDGSAPAWRSWYTRQLLQRTEELTREYENYLARYQDAPGYEKLAKRYEEDLKGLKTLTPFTSLKEAREKFAAFKFKSRSGAPETEEAEQERNWRKQLTDEFKNLKSALEVTEDEAPEKLRRAAASVRELVRLTLRFDEAYTREKRRKNLLDFSDLEHLTLQILKKDGQPTDTARQLSEYYYEIMIDEYQDSNYVQEEILTAVAKKQDGVVSNLFMVGDMKQSIYRFRMARPELFLSKHQRFRKDGTLERKIELDTNFRSAVRVIDPVNFFFRALMQAPVGGIDYDKDAELKPGRRPEKEGGYEGYRAELMLYLPSAGTDEETGEEAEGGQGAEAGESGETLRKAEGEARMIGLEIRRLIDEGMKIPGADGSLRPLGFGDVAVLLRSVSGSEHIFRDVFEELGIPLYMENRAGYYDTFEIRLILSVLEVIDNPMNDVALAAVMASPLFGFSNEELAVLRLSRLPEEGNGLYGALSAYPREHTDALSGKCRAFLEQIAKWRGDAGRMRLSMLIRTVYEDSGLIPFAAAMPGGKRRSGNLEALIAKAETYESGSYQGIFHFIRYVDRIRTSAVDEGETVDAESGENAVRLMTIHKSKGLEFPVVFVAGLAKRFNQDDLKGDLVLHPDYGIGVNAVDHRQRIREKTLPRIVFAEKCRAENYGEELRVLYVAMTRAREKLYLTGILKNEAVLRLAEERFKGPAARLSYSELMKAGCMLDWVLAAYRNEAPAALRVIREEDVLLDTAKAGLKKQVSRLKFLEEMKEAGARAEDAYRKIDEMISFDHHYDDLRSVSVSTTVSSLKALLHREAEEPPAAVYVEDIPEEGILTSGAAEGAMETAGEAFMGTVPVFLSGERPIAGAARGTLYHRVMELVDPEKDVDTELLRLEKAGLISPGERATIKSDKIRAFFCSDLGKRFRKALLRGEAFREKQFIIGVDAGAYAEGLKLPEEDCPLRMIQGVIDLGFYEDGAWVIADYKTDRVKTAEVLKDRYAAQLDLYEAALVQATGQPVREKWIYSFDLSKEIRI